MRRRKEQGRKLKVKILEDRKNGLTYQEIQRKRGASSRTIANLVKGKDPKRFCQECGETDPQKLEEHHPDRLNSPERTITLCASCHSKVTREEQREKLRQKENKSASQETLVPRSLPAKESYAAASPLTSEDWRWVGRYTLYSSGGVALGEAMFDRRLSPWLRWLLGLSGIACLYGGSRIKQDHPRGDNLTS